jgi:hypothetical protein
MVRFDEKFICELRSDLAKYRAKCKQSMRGDSTHDLWVRMAWSTRRYLRDELLGY